MALVKTIIDGREIEVERDRWALEVAREMGLTIPTLCYHPAVEPYGACRLCVVEVTQGRWTWLTTSCDLPIREGLRIKTNTETVLKARRMALEMLWAEAPDAVEIQRLAKELGLEKPRFAARTPGNKCILCGLCVRVCRDVIGQAAIGFARRGVERSVGSPFDASSKACIGCGACVNVCPTGHIETVVQNGLLRMKTWQTDLPLAVCAECGAAFAPQGLIDRLRAKAEKLQIDLRLCPRCRVRTAGRKMAQATRVGAGQGGSKQ